MMKVIVFSSRRYEVDFLKANPSISETTPKIDFNFTSSRLESSTARLAAGCDAACVFVNDDVNAEVLGILASEGVKCLLLRCAGFNQVDLGAAAQHGVTVLRVPAYSPYAVAEFAVALLLTVGRKTHKAYNRTRENNFSLRGLMGFDVHGKTVGVCGTGKIGRLFAKMMLAFGTRVIAYDVCPSNEAKEMGVEYVELEEVYKESDVISLHCPLVAGTRHMIDAEAVGKMKDGVVLVNTSRGELVDMEAVMHGLKKRKIGACAMDVVEGEAGLFFDDHSGEILEDEKIAKLLSFPNVLITPHLAFCTDTAMANIWSTTVKNMLEYAATKEGEGGAKCEHEVVAS